MIKKGTKATMRDYYNSEDSEPMPSTILNTTHINTTSPSNIPTPIPTTSRHNLFRRYSSSQPFLDSTSQNESLDIWPRMTGDQRDDPSKMELSGRCSDDSPSKNAVEMSPDVPIKRHPHAHLIAALDQARQTQSNGLLRFPTMSFHANPVFQVPSRAPAMAAEDNRQQLATISPNITQPHPNDSQHTPANDPAHNGAANILQWVRNLEATPQTSRMSDGNYIPMNPISIEQTVSPSPSALSMLGRDFSPAPPSTTPIGANNGSATSGYAPMQSLIRNPTLFNIIDQEKRDEQRLLAGMSENYGGDPFNVANQSANVPDAENTSLWITNLPPDCDHRMLLSAVRRCGKVFACVVNPPTNKVGRPGSAAPQQPHMTAAAKLVFFDRPGVDALTLQAHRGEFKVGGFVPRVRPNRIRSAAREPGPQCRVLHIEGPLCIVNTHFLLNFFQSKFTFELEEVLILSTVDQQALPSPEGVPGIATQLPRVRQEWRFGSFRCQAEAARQCIYREKTNSELPEDQRALWGQVSVHFGVDPCAP